MSPLHYIDKYSEIKELLEEHQITLFCKLHDQLTEVSSGKKGKVSSKRKTVADHSVEKQEFYLDFLKLSEQISNDHSYQHLQFPQYTLGVLSIVTGNDKIPAFPSCNKNLALTQFCKQSSEGRTLDLVNPETFDDSDHCRHAYKLLILIMYHHLYRTTLRTLGIT